MTWCRARHGNTGILPVEDGSASSDVCIPVLRTSEDFIATLPAQHHFYARSLDLTAEKVHGRACPNGRHVVGFKMVDDVWNCIQSFLHGKDEFVVNGTQKMRHFLCRQEVGRVFQSDRE